ncbi:class III extradiol dioxygenase subunit B-like domain-containing protein [Streptomyces sp. SCSIO 30461]|uniref:class III extradiol dioxygenase subunit B-like domain-containing protein n=1 Tax=Streptomyces sp. SCSIO 30461 TaxID=3118085 RepID=UPI0030CFD057
MLVAAAVCPCPPLLVPDVAAGAAPELDTARAACGRALEELAAVRPDRLVVIGPAGPGEAGTYPQGTPGSFGGYGVDTGVRLGGPGGGRLGEDGDAPADSEAAHGRHGRRLPVALAVAAWLLDRAGWAAAPVEGLAVDSLLSPELCAETGRGLAVGRSRTALLVMGDGSACRALKAPGYLDERAAAFDAAAARALGTADTAALMAIDASLAGELKAVGRAPWQVLAGAAGGSDPAGRLLYEDAPYGVGYFVAAWSCAAEAS